MKTKYKNHRMIKTVNRILLTGVLMLSLSSCNDFLNREPLSNPTPESYFTTVESLAAYLDGKYVYYLPNHGYSNETGYQYGIFKKDDGTDNQVGRSPNGRYVPGKSLVPSDRGEWEFKQIYECNWFIEQVEDKVMKEELAGDPQLAKHYLGEIYFMRAYLYFDKLQSFGDFPIIKTTLPDDRNTLIEASKREPRNEVVRFILEDLQKAADLMAEKEVATTRLSEAAAYLMMSRVALYEATWLKYFKGTPFVPQGDGWPGLSKEYSRDYQFPTGSIEAEIDFFLEKAMSAADRIASNAQLTENTGIVPQAAGETNPYLEMFGDVDLNKYPEVILWMQYADKLTTHGAVIFAQQGNNSVGLTRGFVDNFLMQNGLPVYAPGSGYLGDSTFSAVRAGRDLRLVSFLKEPGQRNWIYDSTEGGAGTEIEIWPGIDKSMGASNGYCTGYSMRKGNSLYKEQSRSNGSWTGCVVFRQAEALLNYIEACYEKEGSLDSKAETYWMKLRERSGITAPIAATVSATDMNEEAKNDWAAYSAGQLIDPMLYNIRRERRSELIGDGLRIMDLKRWRAMDQLITTPYHIEGIHIWDPVMEANLTANKVYLIESGTRATVSPKANSEYFRIYQIGDNDKLDGYNGLTWKMGHYLDPIGADEFLQTAPDGVTKESSPIYQNPYWTMEASTMATN